MSSRAAQSAQAQDSDLRQNPLGKVGIRVRGDTWLRAESQQDLQHGLRQSAQTGHDIGDIGFVPYIPRSQPQPLPLIEQGNDFQLPVAALQFADPVGQLLNVPGGAERVGSGLGCLIGAVAEGIRKRVIGAQKGIKPLLMLCQSGDERRHGRQPDKPPHEIGTAFKKPIERIAVGDGQGFHARQSRIGIGTVGDCIQQVGRDDLERLGNLRGRVAELFAMPHQQEQAQGIRYVLKPRLCQSCAHARLRGGRVENVSKSGYTLPERVNVGRQGRVEASVLIVEQPVQIGAYAIAAAR